jgi:hypothetical protein
MTNCILILWSGGVKTNEMRGRMIVQYVDNCINQSKMYERAEGFSEGC